MKSKSSYGYKANSRECSKELESIFNGRKSLPIKRNNTALIGQLERVLPNQGKIVPLKRFPKEVFMPPINKNKRVTANVRPHPFDFKQSKQSTPIAKSIISSPHVQFIRTITSNELVPSLIGPLLSPTSLNSVGVKSNQCMNLEMTFKSKPLSIISPKIDLIKVVKSSQSSTSANVNSIRLKPIQRTIHSSQGGTIKILLPRNFIAAETRPSTKEEDLVKINSVKNTNKVSGTNSFLDKVVEPTKYDTRVREEICDVTFGRDEFKKGIEL